MNVVKLLSGRKRMGNAAKKARNHVFKEMNSPETLSTEYQKKYIEKKVNRIHKQTLGLSPFTLRAFPCQKINGKFAYIPEDAKPVYNEEDGLWYLNDELIVSRDWHNRVQRQKVAESMARAQEKQKNITQMKPEVLGTD